LVAAHQSNIPFLASALTFDALLAAIPLFVLILIGLTHMAHLSPRASDLDLAFMVQRFMPPHAAVNGQDPFALVERLLTGVTRNRGRLSLYAIPLFVWFSTRLFSSVRISLSAVFHASLLPSRRNMFVAFLIGKLRDSGMVIATVSLFAGNTALSALLGVLKARGATLVAEIPMLRFFVTALGRSLTGLLVFAFGVSVFLLVYKYATSRRLPWDAALLASVFTALAFEAAKRLFALYLQYLASLGRVSADANIGALILFVLWVYYTALVFLYGGVVAETWARVDRR